VRARDLRAICARSAHRGPKLARVETPIVVNHGLHNVYLPPRDAARDFRIRC
jgi:hypothetical protein